MMGQKQTVINVNFRRYRNFAYPEIARPDVQRIRADEAWNEAKGGDTGIDYAVLQLKTKKTSGNSKRLGYWSSLPSSSGKKKKSSSETISTPTSTATHQTESTSVVTIILTGNNITIVLPGTD